MSNKIYVGNLPASTTEAEVNEFFASHGEIKELKLIRDKETDEYRGFGFITFASQEGFESALKADGQEFSGQTLRVSIAREKSRTGGGGGGGNRHYRGQPRATR